MKNNAQAINQERILRRSFWRGPDWAMFVPPLIIADSGFDLPGIATMYPNLQQARSGDIQHLNLTRGDHSRLVGKPETIQKRAWGTSMAISQKRTSGPRR